MTNIASALKVEIARLARKQIRSKVESLKKAVSSQRGEIAALKRRAQTAEQELRRLGKTVPKAKLVVTAESTAFVRFSAKELATQRERLGLSAEDCGYLLGASGQSVYNWESGKVTPRAGHLPAIEALKKLGKRQAQAALAARTTA